MRILSEKMKSANILILVVSLLFVVLGAIQTIQLILFLKQAIRTQGVIVDYEEMSGKYKLLAPVFIFEDIKGAKHKASSPLFSYPPEGKVGEKIHILYLPGNPEKVEVDDFFHIWLFPLSAIGAGFLGFGILWGIKLVMRNYGKYNLEDNANQILQ